MSYDELLAKNEELMETIEILRREIADLDEAAGLGPCKERYHLLRGVKLSDGRWVNLECVNCDATGFVNPELEGVIDERQ